MFTNSASTTVVTDGGTTLTVADGSGFPTTTCFLCLDGVEIVKASSRVGNVFTVERAQEGTSQATRSGTVFLVLTAEALQLRNLEAAAVGTHAARSVKGIWADIDFTTIYHNGTIPGLHLSNSVLASGWLWFNQGSATLTQSRDAVILEDATYNATHQLRAVRKAIGDPVTLTCCVEPQIIQASAAAAAYFGVGFFADTSALFFGPKFDPNSVQMPQMGSQLWATVFGGFGAHGHLSAPMSRMWLKVQLTATHIIASYSADGCVWQELYNAVKGAILGTITHYGFGCSNKMLNANDATWQQRFAIRYWKET